MTQTWPAFLRPLARALADWSVFVLAHLSIFFHWARWGDLAFGDVYLYQFWVRGPETPVLDADWVYPVLGLVPMRLLSGIENPDFYVHAWLLLAMAVNAAVFLTVRRWESHGRTAGLWWCAFIALLGPVALARLDTYASALAIIAIGLILRRPAVASGLLMAAAWIKVAHGFWLPVLFVATRDRLRTVLAPAAAVSAIVVSAALLAGSGWRVFSFGFQQNDRGLQVESALATPFHVARLFGADYYPVYNEEIYTVELTEASPRLIAHGADFILVGVVLVITALVGKAVRRGDRDRLVIAALVGVTASLLLFNKVGSPQLYIWLAAPLMGVIALRGQAFSSRSVALVAGAGLAMAGITQLIFPHYYQEFMNAEPWLIWLYALRTVLLVGLLAWSLRECSTAGNKKLTQSRHNDPFWGVH